MRGIVVELEISNKLSRDTTITIPAGTVFEAAQTDMGIQNVVIIQDYTITLSSRSRAIVKLRGNCLNQKRSYPKSATGRVTPFRYAGNSYGQQDIWNAMSAPGR